MVHPNVIIISIFQMTSSEELSSFPKVTQPIGRGIWVKPRPYNSKAFMTPPSMVRKTKNPTKPWKDRLKTQLDEVANTDGWKVVTV